MYRLLNLFFWFGLLLLLALSIHAQEPSITERVQNFSQRQNDYLLKIASAPENSTREQAIAMVLAGLKDESSIFASIRTEEITALEFSVLLRVLHRALTESWILSEESQKNLSTEMGKTLLNGGASLMQVGRREDAGESEELLRLSNLYLWALHLIQSQNVFVWPDKKKSEEYESGYLQAIQEILSRQAKTGFAERSSGYYSLLAAALFNLRDFGGRTQIVTKADSLLDVLFLDIAQQSLDQGWGGAHSRTFERISPLPGGWLQTLLFDLPEPILPQAFTDWTLFHAADTRYQPPEILLKVGSDRRQRGSYEVRNQFPSQSDEKPLQEEYTYVTPEFVLGSFSLRNEAAPTQSRPWDLMVWDDQKGENHLFSFLGAQMYSGGHNNDEEFYLWNSTVMQHKNVLFCQFHRSDRKRMSHQGEKFKIDRNYARQPARVWVADAFSPVSEEEGWWFCDTGRVYIAFRPLEGNAYWWRTAETSDPMDGGAAILSFLNLDTALLLEVDEASRFSSFEQFKNQIKTSPLKVDEDFVTYVSRRGDVLLFPRKMGDFLVNGRNVNSQLSENKDLYFSPYLRSQFGSGIYIAEWKPFALHIDLSDDENPKRVLTPAR